MPLQKEVLEYNFSRGLDEQTDKWVTDGLLRATNCYYNKSGALEMPPGHEVVNSGVTDSSMPLPAGGRMLARRDSELLSVGGYYMHAYSDHLDRWAYRGRPSPCTYSESAVMTTGYDTILECCAAYVNNITVYAMETTTRGGVVVTARDNTTGGIIIAPTQLDVNGSNPRVVTAGNTIHVIWYDGTSAHKFSSLNTAATQPAFTSAAAISLSAATSRVWSVAEVGGLVYIAYGSGTSVYIDKLSADLSTVHTQTNFTETITAIDLAGYDETIVYVVYADNTSPSPVIKCRGYTDSGTSFSTTWGPTTVVTEAATTDYIRSLGICRDSTASIGSAVIVWHGDVDNTSAAGHFVSRQKIDYQGALSGSASKQNCVGLAGRPFLRSGRVFYVAYFYGFTSFAEGNGANPAKSETYVRHYYLFDTEAFVDDTAAKTDIPVAHFGAGVAFAKGGYATAHPNLNSYPYETSTGVWAIALPRVYGPDDGDVLYESVFDFTSDEKHAWVQAGGSTYLTGAVTQRYDGERLYEAHFLHDPWVYSVTEVTSGSTTTGPGYGFQDGDIRIAVTYAYRDANGDLMRSGIAAIHTTTVAKADHGDGSNLSYLQVKAPAYSVNGIQRESDSFYPSVYIEFWTTDDQTTAGPFYLAGRVACSPASAVFVTSPSLKVPYGDEEQLPFAGAELIPDPPQYSRAIATWQDRVCLARGNQVLISKPAVDGYSASWSGFLSVSVPRGQGDVTGLATLGESLAVFTERRIYRLYGTPPAANGQGAQLSNLEAVVTDGGCVNTRSVCVTEHGVFYESRRGIMMLGKDWSTAPIGEAVRDKLDTYPNINTVEAFETEPLIGFGVSNAGETDGTYLLYDTRHNAWTTMEVAQVSTYTPMSGLVLDGVHHYMTVNGGVHRRIATYAQGAVDNMNFTVRTPWIKPNGINGYWRARRLILLGELQSAHQVTIDIHYDYNDQDPGHTLRMTWAQIQTMKAIDTYVEQFRHKLPREPVNSIRFTITVSTSVTSGAGVRLHGIRLEYARKQSALQPGQFNALPAVAEG